MRRGFSIVELITVILIIAIMLSMAALALNGVRAAGRGAQCKSNLRQMALAATQYAHDFNYFPPAIRYENDGTFTRHAWDWVTTFDGRVIGAGAIWGYTGHPDEVMQCPDYDGPSNFNGDPFTGYNYNTSYLGGEASFPSLGWSNFRLGVPQHQCSRASSCAMFGDGGWASGANKFMRAPENRESVSWSLIYSGGQAFRHRHSTHIAYVDGHVGATADPRPGDHATDTLLERMMQFPTNGFLSDDDNTYRPR